MSRLTCCNLDLPVWLIILCSKNGWRRRYNSPRYTSKTLAPTCLSHVVNFILRVILFLRLVPRKIWNRDEDLIYLSLNVLMNFLFNDLLTKNFFFYSIAPPRSEMTSNFDMIRCTSGDSGTRATRAEPELQNDAEATPALGLLGLSLSYEMMEGLLLFKF